MSNYFILYLDTVGPSNPRIELESGSQFTTQQLISAKFSTDDESAVGYQMKVWGDIDVDWAISNGLLSSGATESTEENAVWIVFSEDRQIKLSDGNSTKTIYCKLRDDVHNESEQVFSSIILDSELPTVTITGPDVTKISKQDGRNISSFSFQVDEDFVEYKVKVVSSISASHDTGVQIPTQNGSVNMSGTGDFGAHTPISCQIVGSDLELASSGDGEKIIKVFVLDKAGHWSS